MKMIGAREVYVLIYILATIVFFSCFEGDAEKVSPPELVHSYVVLDFDFGSAELIRRNSYRKTVF